MFCKNCGTEVNEGAAFCPKCGEKIVIPKNMVSGEKETEQAATVLKFNDKKDRALRLVAALFFSIWTLFLIRAIWDWYDRISPILKNGTLNWMLTMDLVFIIPIVISNLCMIYAILKNEKKLTKVASGIGLLGIALYFLCKVYSLYRGLSSLPKDPKAYGYEDPKRYAIKLITGYDIYNSDFNPLTMYYFLSAILGVVLFTLFILKLNHNISSIIIIIVAILWTYCSVQWMFLSDLVFRKPIVIGFSGIVAYVLLSIILTRKQAQQ